MDFKEEIHKAYTALKAGKIILYPTDTVWGIGCDARNIEAVDRIYKLKRRQDSKSMLCLVDDVPLLERSVKVVPDAAYTIIDTTEKPTTIIYDQPIGIAPNLLAPDGSLGFRVVQNQFCKRLIYKLRTPLVSTSANISGQPTPQSFQEISQEILDGVDYIVNLHQDQKSSKSSTIIKLTNSSVFTLIRK